MSRHFLLILFASACAVAEITVIFNESYGPFATKAAISFENKGVIGSGGTSSVVLVSHGETQYALKVVENAETNNEQLFWNLCFESEWKAFKKLRNDKNLRGVVKLIAYGSAIGDYTGRAILMEYVDSENLYALGFENPETSLKETLEVGYQLVYSLEGFFRSGMTHRDLKPDNMLYRHSDGKSELLLFDMAFAFYKGSTFDGNTMIGTPLYMSPNLMHCGTKESAPPCPNDDLRAVMYMLAVSSLGGKLAWDEDCNKYGGQEALRDKIIERKNKFENNLHQPGLFPNELSAVLVKIREHLSLDTVPKDYSLILQEFKTQLKILDNISSASV